MKVKIGKYLNYYGPYQIAKTILFWKDKESDVVYNFGDWLSGGDCKDTLLSRFCNWLHSKRKRKIQVHIEPWDTWSLDTTLAYIVLPALKQVKAAKRGAPNVDDSDVPTNLKRKKASKDASDYDIDALWFDRWDYVLDEMIFAFEACLDHEAESKFFDHSDVEKGSNVIEQVSKIKYDKKGLDAFKKRKQNGFRLFGKYYQCLWT